MFVSACLAGGPGPAAETALGAFRRALEGTLASAGATTRRLEPDALLSLAAKLVAPDIGGYRDGETERPARRWSPRDPLHEQCIAPGRALTVAPTGLSFHHPDSEDIAVRVLSAIAFPEVWPGWRGNALIGDFHRDFLQPGCPVLTCLTVVTGDEAAGEKAFLKSARATQQAGTGIARYLPGFPEKARDWQAVTERIKDGEKLVRACYMAAVYAPLDALDEVEQAVRAIYHGQGWRVNAERYMQLPSWLACLPMVSAGGLDANLERMGRMKTLLTSSAVNLAPLHGEWRGQPAIVEDLEARRAEAAVVSRKARNRQAGGRTTEPDSGAPEPEFSVHITARTDDGRRVTFLHDEKCMPGPAVTAAPSPARRRAPSRPIRNNRRSSRRRTRLQRCPSDRRSEPRKPGSRARGSRARSGRPPPNPMFLPRRSIRKSHIGNFASTGSVMPPARNGPACLRSTSTGRPRSSGASASSRGTRTCLPNRAGASRSWSAATPSISKRASASRLGSRRPTGTGSATTASTAKPTISTWRLTRCARSTTGWSATSGCCGRAGRSSTIPEPTAPTSTGWRAPSGAWETPCPGWRVCRANAGPGYRAATGDRRGDCSATQPLRVFDYRSATAFAHGQPNLRRGTLGSPTSHDSVVRSPDIQPPPAVHSCSAHYSASSCRSR